MIEAIIFDMGGVLLDLDIPKGREGFREYLGYEKADEILDASHGRGLYADIESGRLNADEFRSEILKDSRPGTDPEMVDKAMWSLLLDIAPYKFDLLKQMKEKYDIYLLSNNNPISWVRCKQVFDEGGASVEELFNRIFLSFELKSLKPSREIYEKMVAGIPEHRPENMLFIDDSMFNVEAAQSVGLNALYYPQGDDLRKAIEAKLEELGC